MRKFILSTSLVMLALLIVACGGRSTELLNTTWQWTALIEITPAAQSIVPNPEKYTLVFNEDSTFTATADCNQVSGSYELDGDQLSLLPGLSTIAECEPDSLYDLFLANLIMIESYAIKEGMLILKLGAGAGELQFQNAGPQ